jgi:hypothetical protein
MITTERLLRVYPRWWRDRYGDELIATVGPGPLRLAQAADLIAGALDAWWSADVRTAVRSSPAASNRGGAVMLKSLLSCEPGDVRAPIRDALIGAAVMIVTSVVFTRLGHFSQQQGWLRASHTFESNAFIVPFILSMPFWLMRGTPRLAQIAIVVATMALLAAIGAYR